jgi:hypothetical protein
MNTTYARTAGIIALAIALTACSAGRTPHPTPTAPATLSPTGSISALPTPADYMTFLCLRFETSWQGWRPQQEITPDMKLTVKDLARPGSKYREEAQNLVKAITVTKIKVDDQRLREAIDNILGMEYMALAGKCDTEISGAS